MFARNYSSVGKKWLPDKVISVAQHSVKVKLTSGLVIHHHFDQISKELLTNPQLSQCQSYTYIPVNSDEPVSETVSSPEAPTIEQIPHYRRYPLRIRKAPDRLNL